MNALAWLRFAQEHYETLGAISFLATSIYRNYRLRRYHAEHLERERTKRFAEVNEISRTLSTAYASEEPITLDDLLSHAERDFSLRSSEASSELPPQRPSNPPPPPPRPPPRIPRPPRKG